MAHTLVQNLIHLVFSTKGRRKLIPKQRLARTWAYLAGICKKEKIFVHEIGGTENHVHMLIQLPPTMSLSDAVQGIKAGSSKWLGESFAWQRGFGAFSVSKSNLNAVIHYVRNQESHHRKMTYDDEFIALLKKHGVPFDPKYVFD